MCKIQAGKAKWLALILVRSTMRITEMMAVHFLGKEITPRDPEICWVTIDNPFTLLVTYKRVK
jgi:hypothetical protein